MDSSYFPWGKHLDCLILHSLPELRDTALHMLGPWDDSLHCIDILCCVSFICIQSHTVAIPSAGNTHLPTQLSNQDILQNES